MVSEETALEKESLENSVAVYRSKIMGLREMEMESLDDPFLRLIKTTISPFADKIKAWVTECRSAGSGRRAGFLKRVEEFDPGVAAFLTLKTVINGIYQPRLFQTLGQTVGQALELEARLSAYQAQAPVDYKLTKRYIAESPLRKNAGYRKGLLLHQSSKRIDWKPWSKPHQVQVGCLLLELCKESTGFLEFVSGRAVRKSKGPDTSITVVPSETLLDWIDAEHSRCEALRPQRLPMICPPLSFTKINDGGYLIPEFRKPLVTWRKQSVGPTLTNEDSPIVFQAVNTLQAVPQRVNAKVYAVAKHLWEHSDGLPKAAEKYDKPKPHRPKVFQSEQEKRIWKREARQSFFDNIENRGRRIAVSQTLSVAAKMLDRRVWYPYHFDFRGRMYTAAQYLTPQGSDLSKGLLEFANGHRLTPKGVYWLKVHLANCYGVDKVSFEERVNWAEEHEQKILACASDPYTNKFWHAADGPFAFLQAAFDYAGYRSDPENHQSHTPVRMDGTCNGIQHLAALSRDADTGALVNLLPREKPARVYTAVANETVKRLNDDSNPMAKVWLEYGVDQSLCKRPTMIRPYGGTINAVEKYIEASLKENAREGKPYPPGPRLTLCTYLAHVMWAAMCHVISGPHEIMEWSRDVAKTITDSQQAICWTSPSGFPVIQARTRRKGKRIKTRLGDSIVQLTLKEETDKLDGVKQANGLAPNWIHSLDAAALHFTVVALAEQGVTDLVAIHDSYGCHANFIDLLHAAIREQFVRMYKRDVVGEFTESVVGSLGPEALPPFPTKGGLEIEQVLESRYFFS